MMMLARALISGPVLAMSLLLAGQAHAATGSSSAGSPEGAPSDASARDGVGFGALPVGNYDADEGFGLGAFASVFLYDGKRIPWQYRLDFLVFVTTEGMQIHRVRLDAVRVFDLPLRIEWTAAWFSTVNQTFCGFGNQVSCDAGEAIDRGRNLDLRGADLDAFVRRYYRARGVFPLSDVVGRWALPTSPSVELSAGWRVGYFLAGQLDFSGWQPGPFPGSKYGAYSSDGEDGLSSVLQLGAMVDERDNEAWPRRGYWVEGSVRGSSGFWGSHWNYVGANLTLRGYVPLTADKRLVLADRLVFDGVVGDAHTAELGRTGSRESFFSYGGGWLGRGIRSAREIGRIKVMQQVELRWDPLAWTIVQRELRLGFVTFLDAGWVGVDWDDWGGDPLRPTIGQGGGIRLVWDEDFVVRADLGFSAAEHYRPSLYVNVGNVF